MAGHPGLPWIAFLVALAARVFRIRHQSFWVDEIFTLNSVRHVIDVDAGHLLHDLHGPLYTAVAALLSGLLQGEWLRLISAVAGALAVLPIHAWVRRIAGENAAAVAAFLAALSPFAVWYGQELRNYSFVLLFSALALLAIESWRERDPGVRDFLSFVLWAWLGLLSNLTFVLFLIALGIASTLGASRRRLRHLAWMAAAGVLVALLSLPWTMTFVRDMQPQRLVVDQPAWDETPLRGETTFTPLAIPYTMYTLLGGFSLGPSLEELHRGTGSAVKGHLPLLVLAGGLFASTVVLGFLGLSGRRKLEFALLALVILGLASFLAIKNFKVFNVRYVSMLWPPLILLVAQGAIAVKMVRLRQALVAGLFALFLFALSQHYWNPTYAKADLRAAAEELETFADEESLVLVAVVADPFQHYFQGPQRVKGLWPGMGPKEIRQRADGETSPVLLVSARDWEWGDEQILLEAFDDLEVERSAKLHGVRIYTMRKAH